MLFFYFKGRREKREREKVLGGSEGLYSYLRGKETFFPPVLMFPGTARTSFW
jgi:hypothetical protein